MEKNNKVLTIMFCLIASMVLSLSCCVIYLKAFAVAPVQNNYITNTDVNVNEANSSNSPIINTSEGEIAAINGILEQVVEIKATGSGFTSSGSGVIYAQDDNYTYIVTNHHVIEDAYNFTVTLYDGTVHNSVSLVGGDDIGDIAILRIELLDIEPAVIRKLAGENSIPLVVGETAIVIGNPLGVLGGTVTRGIVSALSREISVDGTLMTLLQTDAAINSGNSGGGVFDAYGRLIGIVNAKVISTGVEGLGFAIPIDKVCEKANQLIDTYTYDTNTGDVLTFGYIEGRINIGLTIVEFTSDQYTYVLGRPILLYEAGVYIDEIDTTGDAYICGLREGDKITAASKNSQSISLDGTSISNALENATIQDDFEFNVIRNGVSRSFEFVVSQYVYEMPNS